MGEERGWGLINSQCYLDKYEIRCVFIFLQPYKLMPDVESPPSSPVSASPSIFDSVEMFKKVLDASIVESQPCISADVGKSRNASRRAQREALRSSKKALQSMSSHHSMVITQMSAETLRKQGHEVGYTLPYYGIIYTYIVYHRIWLIRTHKICTH